MEGKRDRQRKIQLPVCYFNFETGSPACQIVRVLILGYRRRTRHRKPNTRSQESKKKDKDLASRSIDIAETEHSPPHSSRYVKMLFRKDLSIVLVATYFTFSHAAVQLSIDTATCQDVTYTIVGSSQEMASLPTTGMIYYKGQTQPFNLDTSTLSNVTSGKESTLNGSVIYHQDLFLVDGPVLVTVQIGSPDATLTGASLVTSCNSTQPSTSSVSESLNPASTTSAIAETSSSSMVPVNTSTSETLSATPIPTVETVQTSILSALSTAMPDVTSTSSAEEHKDKIRIEEGASVGVLGVLFLIVVLSGCAYVRRQNKRARMQRTWQTTEPFVSGSRDSFTQVRSVA